MNQNTGYGTSEKNDGQTEKKFIVISAMVLPVLFGYYFISEAVGHIVQNEDMRENVPEFVLMAVLLLLCSILTWVAVQYKKVDKIAPIIALLMSVLIIPEVIIAGSKYNSGTAVWYIAGVLYIIFIMDGKWKYVFLGIEAVFATFAYFLCELMNRHPDYGNLNSMNLYITLMLVSVMLLVIVRFELELQREAMDKIEAQKEEIDVLNKSQNQFFSSMSHEIRTPINTIIGLNEMTLRENVSDEINENAANIQSAGKMLLHLINDILDMSKFESGQMKLSQTAYHTGDMLSDIVGMLWLRAKEKNLEFHISVAPELPEELIGDEVRIKQILINLMTNAIKYTNEGSVTLSIQYERMGNGYANVIYTVSDTGMGIKKESIPYLFDAFKRVDEEKNRYIEGTGLGLSIVKQFVELMGGKITVNSVYTKGSTFIIEIPQQIANEEGIGELDMERRHGLNNREDYHQSFEAPEARILVVDDTAANLLVVKKLLRDTKVQIDIAGSGKEALEKTLESMYHVIFMDHMMPNMDGIECMHKIKTQPGGFCRDSKIIALTANAGGESALLYAKEGFDGYLVKPITGRELENELRRQLPGNLVTLTGSEEEILEESLLKTDKHQKKAIIAITTESVADLPKSVLSEYHIAVIPHMVETEEGIFRDGLEIEQQGLLAYMEGKQHTVKTKSPDVAEHESFFARQLLHANNVIHISISSSVANSGCPAALEAARAFDNVFVIDTGHLSSGQGLMVIEAARMVKEGRTVGEIVKELERMKSRVHTSFIVDNLDYLARAGQVGGRIANITKAFMIRPVLILKKGDMTVGKLYFGSRERAWKKYVSNILDTLISVDRRILFVTYAGLSQNELKKIKEEIDKKMVFEKIYFQKASPAIAVNCGPGSFGLLFQTER